MGLHRESWTNDEKLLFDQSEDEIDSREKIIRPATSLYTAALEYRLCRPVNRDEYNDKIKKPICKVWKRLRVQMWDQLFGASDPTKLLFFLKAFTKDSDSDCVLECAAIWLIKYFIQQQ